MNTKSTSGCGCSQTAEQALAAANGQRRVLYVVLVINVLLFGGEYAAGWWASSSALQADSLDSLGDACVYALSLAVISRSLRWRSGAAIVKGLLQGVFGIAVLFEVARRMMGDAVPIAPIMAVAASVALAGNLTCFVLLTRFRKQGINMRSVWLCSRNDMVNNIGVIVAAVAVLWVGHGWPDWVIGALIALLFLQTSASVLREAISQWRSGTPPGCTQDGAAL